MPVACETGCAHRVHEITTMNQQTNTSDCRPVAVDEIDNLIGVECHFQADMTHTVNYASNEKAQNLAELSAEFLKLATVTADAGGFGAVNRIVASGKQSKFLLFALNCRRVQPAGPRTFGLKTLKAVSDKELVKQINNLV